MNFTNHQQESNSQEPVMEDILEERDVGGAFNLLNQAINRMTLLQTGFEHFTEKARDEANYALSISDHELFYAMEDLFKEIKERLYGAVDQVF